MGKEIWEIWLEDAKRRESDVKKYMEYKQIKIETETTELIDGHIQKADHNLKFAKSALALQEFNDWAIVSSYYAMYHASLALCALKGYATKNHLVTLLILIKEFYQSTLTKEEIEDIRDISIEKEEVLYYVQIKSKRIHASYSTEKLFDARDAEAIRKKAISFVNKAKEIIDAEGSKQEKE